MLVWESIHTFPQCLAWWIPLGRGWLYTTGNQVFLTVIELCSILSTDMVHTHSILMVSYPVQMILNYEGERVLCVPANIDKGVRAK
jgi:hypothetical protein